MWPGWLWLKDPGEVHWVCARVVVCHCRAKSKRLVEVLVNCQTARWRFEGHELLAAASWPTVREQQVSR